MPGERRPAPTGRTAAVVGLVGTGLGLALTELAAGIFGTPSLIGAVAGRVVTVMPGTVDSAVISVFGTSDKSVLVVVIVLVALGLGAATARSTVRRGSWVAWAVFGTFGALGVAATAPEPHSDVLVTAVTTAISAAAGVYALLRLLRVAEPVAPESGTADAGIGRRRFLEAAGTVTLVAVVALTTGRLLAGRAAGVARSLTRLPRPVRPAPSPSPGASLAVAGITPLVSSNGDFYRIDTAILVPQVDTTSWSLRVFGLVDRPFTLTFDELLAMPMVEDYVTLTCVSNEVGGNLAGNARWLGVPLTDLLDRAGVRPGADQLIGRAVDGFTVGMPTAAVRDGRVAMIAVGMNGEPLPFEHGYPARIVVSGLYGYVSATKWVTELELSTFQAYDAYWVQRGWSQQAPIKTQSRIDVPRDGAHLAAGAVTIAGVAWAQSRGIERVEVQVDGGPWQPAELADAISADTWRQWRLSWRAAAGTHTISVRATDAKGDVQTAQVAPPEPDGATGHHTITVQAG